MVVDGRVEMMRNYWATFVDDADSDDLVSMQNERVYRQMNVQPNGAAHPQQEKLQHQSGRKHRRHASTSSASADENAGELALPKPGKLMLETNVPLDETDFTIKELEFLTKLFHICEFQPLRGLDVMFLRV